MIRNEEYFINELKKYNAYEIFLVIAECSAKYISQYNLVSITKVDIEIIYKALEKNNILKSKDLIKQNIDYLIHLGLIKYIIDDENPYKNNATDNKDSERYQFYNKKGINIEESQISLTDDMEVSGKDVYRKICSIEKEKKSDGELEKTIKNCFESAFEDSFSPYRKEINEKQTKLTNRVNEAEKIYENIQKNLDNNIIKNIQVLSIFVGIIAIMFSNIVAIKELVNNGIKGIVVINLSIISSLFFMIILTRLVIINRDKKSMYGCIIIFVLIFMMLFVLIK